MAIELTETENSIIKYLRDSNCISFSPDEVARATGVKAPGWHLGNLVSKGQLFRASKGIYVAGEGTELEYRLGSPYTHLSKLMAKRPYYVGGPVALYQNGLTAQVYWSKIDVFCEKHLDDRVLGWAKVNFHKSLAHKFEYGAISKTMDDQEILMSDPEKTVLDILEFPKIFGETDGGVVIVSSLFSELDVGKLVAYATRMAKTSSCQKLGVLLDRKNIKPVGYDELLGKVNLSKGVPVLDKWSERKGRWNKKWRIIENDSLKEEVSFQWR